MFLPSPPTRRAADGVSVSGAGKRPALGGVRAGPNHQRLRSSSPGVEPVQAASPVPRRGMQVIVLVTRLSVAPPCKQAHTHGRGTPEARRGHSGNA
jgi:hypothetical protein